MKLHDKGFLNFENNLFFLNETALSSLPKYLLTIKLAKHIKRKCIACIPLEFVIFIICGCFGPFGALVGLLLVAYDTCRRASKIDILYMNFILGLRDKN